MLAVGPLGDSVSGTLWEVASATAHRDLRGLPEDVWTWVGDKFTAGAVWLRREHGTRTGISGMARGGDLVWARAVLAAGLDLWCYIPYPQQPDRWPAQVRDEYYTLLERAARVRRFGDRPDNRYLFARNDRMREDADVVFALYDPARTTGGTCRAYRTARRTRPVVHLDPRARRVHPAQLPVRRATHEKLAPPSSNG